MSYQEIKTLFEEEIKKSIEWQETILVKNYIIQTINEPNILMNVIYNFSQSINIDIFKMAFKIQFGFQNDNISDFQCIINMMEFLN